MFLDIERRYKIKMGLEDIKEEIDYLDDYQLLYLLGYLEGLTKEIRGIRE